MRVYEKWFLEVVDPVDKLCSAAIYCVSTTELKKSASATPVLFSLALKLLACHVKPLLHPFISVQSSTFFFYLVFSSFRVLALDGSTDSPAPREYSAEKS
jgi:hypothetical protein